MHGHYTTGVSYTFTILQGCHYHIGLYYRGVIHLVLDYRGVILWIYHTTGVSYIYTTWGVIHFTIMEPLPWGVIHYTIHFGLSYIILHWGVIQTLILHGVSPYITILQGCHTLYHLQGTLYHTGLIHYTTWGMSFTCYTTWGVIHYTTGVFTYIILQGWTHTLFTIILHGVIHYTTYICLH